MKSSDRDPNNDGDSHSPPDVDKLPTPSTSSTSPASNNNRNQIICPESPKYSISQSATFTKSQRDHLEGLYESMAYQPNDQNNEFGVNRQHFERTTMTMASDELNDCNKELNQHQESETSDLIGTTARLSGSGSGVPNSNIGIDSRTIGIGMGDQRTIGSGPMPMNGGVGASMVSFSSSMDTSQLHESMGEKYAAQDIAGYLMIILSENDAVESSARILKLSAQRHLCHPIRINGGIEILIKLLHPADIWAQTPSLPDDSEVLSNCTGALLNIVNEQKDETKRKREIRILKALSSIREQTISFRAIHARITQPAANNPYTQQCIVSVSALMQFSFDEDLRMTMTHFGALQAFAELLISEVMAYGLHTRTDHSSTMRHRIGMALTNLTYGNSQSKLTLCMFPRFLRTVNQQIECAAENVIQVFASVLRNLSWKAEQSSKVALRECGAVPCLMSAAMRAEQENTIKSLLSALWNLSSHCQENKADICRMDNALSFLVKILSFESELENNLQVVENGSGILRNVSSVIALNEQYRLILRRNHCCRILLTHLRSSSLTVVSNCCGTLWNLSARCAEDQELLWRLGAVGKLRSLINSRHRMIATGSASALKNLLTNRPKEFQDEFNSGLLPSRKWSALEQEIDEKLFPSTRTGAAGNTNIQQRQTGPGTMQPPLGWSSDTAVNHSHRLGVGNGPPAPDMNPLIMSQSSSQAQAAHMMHNAHHSARVPTACTSQEPPHSARAYYNTYSTAGHQGAHDQYLPTAPLSARSASLRSSSGSLSKQELMDEDRMSTQRFQRRQSRATTLPKNTQSKPVHSHKSDGFALPFSGQRPAVQFGHAQNGYYGTNYEQPQQKAQMHQVEDDDDEENVRTFASAKTPQMSQRGSRNELNKLDTKHSEAVNVTNEHYSATHNHKHTQRQLHRPSSSAHRSQVHSGSHTPHRAAMFSMNASRHSSVESLNSADDENASLHSTHTSAPSTRLNTGGHVSPSELPDSPGQQSPVPCPPNNTIVIHTPANNQEKLAFLNNFRQQMDATANHKLDQSSSQDDNQSILSGLTIDSGPIQPIRKLKHCVSSTPIQPANQTPAPQFTGNFSTDTTRSQEAGVTEELHEQTGDTDNEPVYENYEEQATAQILQESIESAMPTPRSTKKAHHHHHKSHNKKATGKSKASRRLNTTEVSPQCPNVSPNVSGNMNDSDSVHVNNVSSSQNADCDMDTMKVFAHEDDQNTTAASTTHNTQPNSRAERADLQECIQSAMPKPIISTKFARHSQNEPRQRNVAIAKPMLRHEHDDDNEVRTFACDATPDNRSRSASGDRSLESCEHVGNTPNEHEEEDRRQTQVNEHQQHTTNQHTTNQHPVNHHLIQDITPPNNFMAASSCFSMVCGENDEHIRDASQLIKEDEHSSGSGPPSTLHLHQHHVFSTDGSDTALSEDNFEVIDMEEIVPDDLNDTLNSQDTDELANSGDRLHADVHRLLHSSQSREDNQPVESADLLIDCEQLSHTLHTPSPRRTTPRILTQAPNPSPLQPQPNPKTIRGQGAPRLANGSLSPSAVRRNSNGTSQLPAVRTTRTTQLRANSNQTSTTTSKPNSQSASSDRTNQRLTTVSPRAAQPLVKKTSPSPNNSVTDVNKKPNVSPSYTAISKPSKYGVGRPPMSTKATAPPPPPKPRKTTGGDEHRPSATSSGNKITRSPVIQVDGPPASPTLSNRSAARVSPYNYKQKTTESKSRQTPTNPNGAKPAAKSPSEARPALQKQPPPPATKMTPSSKRMLVTTV